MKIFLTYLFTCIAFAGYAQQEKFIINFHFNKYDITPVARQKLDSFLQNSVSIEKIELYGHCDFIGNDRYNDALSEKRVAATKNYLVVHGVAESVFRSEKGFGKRQPLNQNVNAEERAMNRRVEIIIQRKTEEPVVTTEKKDTPEKQQTLRAQINDTATKTGTHIILKTLNFIGGRHFLVEQSVPVLTELLNALKDNPELVIEIHGHVCCTTGAEDGFDINTNTRNLSVNRARVIYEYLVSHGISPDHLSYKGFGHSHPLVYPEDTEDRRTTNRRVEIKIVRK